jgi:hypothetical protein
VKADKAAQDISVPTIARILVPVDKAPLSMKAASYAIHLAELEKAKDLIVMHVVEDIKQGGAIGLRAKYGDMRMIEGFKKSQNRLCGRNDRADRRRSQEKRIEHKKRDSLCRG